MFYVLKPLLKGSAVITFIGLLTVSMFAMVLAYELEDSVTPKGNCYNPPYGCQ